MELQQKAALLALKGKVISDIDVRDITDELISKGLLNIADKERLQAASGSVKQANTLVDIIVERNKPNSFSAFLDSVKEPYPHVWEKLVEVRASPQTALSLQVDQCESIFIEGGIPVLPQGNVELEFMPKLKTSLVNLSQRADGGWIVVWGQAGSGKSIMAAQAVRGFCSSNKRIAAYYFNKVFWVHIGKLSNEELLVKMQNFCKRIDTSGRFQPPVDLEAARDLLRSILIKHYPVCLIVLDDVWDPMVLKFFNVQARILVTTRSSDILSRVQRGEQGRTEIIHVDKGFTEASTISLLKQMVIQDDERASRENVRCFKRIHEGCNGSPFAVSIFGSLLAQNMSRFEYFFKKYKNTGFSSDSVEAGDYHYPNISEAIMVSVEDLNDVDKNLYSRLAIFMSNSPLSPEFLAAYCWTELDKEEACEKIEKFIRRSIATEEKAEEDRLTFSLHEIIVSALRASFQRETIGYNSEFVSNVLQSRGDCSSWHDMDDDCHYLANNFLYHLISDEKVSIEDKKKLLLDFDFLSWLCCKVGPDGLAFSYRFAVKALKLDDTWKQMETFIRSPIFRIQSLCSNDAQSASSFIQLALTFAEGESLLQHVKDCVIQHQHSACFFQWMNRAQTEDQIEDTLELGCNVTSYTLSNDLAHVTVVSDCSVVVKDLNTRSTLYRRQDKEFDKDRVISAFFGADRESIWVLTATRLIRYKLPEYTLEANSLTSPMVPTRNKRSSVFFPTELQRSRTHSHSEEEEGSSAQLVWPDKMLVDTEFTATCFSDEMKLLVGTQNGRIYELTVTNKFINCSYDYSINPSATTELCVSHISCSNNSTVVSGPDSCAYVYESRPNDSVPTSNVRKYTGFQKLREPPIQSLLGVQNNFRYIVSISKHEIHLWDPRTLKNLLIEECQNLSEFTSLALSSDFVYLAVSNSRAHIYLYRIVTDDFRGIIALELVEEFNGTGTQARCLTFRDKCLYSLSNVSSESVLIKWRNRISTSSPCFKRELNRQSSIYFGNECCTLRLRTVFDAVSTADNRIVMACQSVRRSLLILESTVNGNLRHIGKYKSSESQLDKIRATGIARDGKSAVFIFPNLVIAAIEGHNNAWNFEPIKEPVFIRDLVMLQSGHGFIGSDRSSTLVLYGKNYMRVKDVKFNHDRLMPLQLPHSIESHRGAQAVLLTQSTWHFVTESLDIVYGGGICDLIQDEAAFFVCIDISDDGRYAAGGLSNGHLAVWNLGNQSSATIPSRCTQPLRCVKFAPGSRLLAGAYDNGRFSLWHLNSTEASFPLTLLDCHPVPISLVNEAEVAESVISLAWSVASGLGSTADSRYRLIMACDRCVWILCCLTGRDLLTSRLDPACISLVPLYSRQGVSKVLVLGQDGEDLLYVDNAHTVFWLRSLTSIHGHRRRSAP